MKMLIYIALIYNYDTECDSDYNGYILNEELTQAFSKKERAIEYIESFGVLKHCKLLENNIA